MAGRGLSAPRRLFADAEELAAHAAERVAQEISAAVASRARASLVLAGGKTPRRCYELLAGVAGLPWERVELFWGDERCVAPDDEASNFRMAREALVERVAIPAGNVHRIAGERAAAEAADAYEREIHATLGPAPLFDVVLLGMGADGHTASLFPGTTAMEVLDRTVVATWVPRLGAHRVTLTRRALGAARLVLFLVAGADKGPALARALAGRPDAAIPASCIRAEGELLWLLDAHAANALEEAAP